MSTETMAKQVFTWTPTQRRREDQDGVITGNSINNGRNKLSGWYMELIDESELWKQEVNFRRHKN